MNKILAALLPLLAMILAAPICVAQSDDETGNHWLPPSWVLGSGYTPYDYPGSLWYRGSDPFSYYSYQGKTYHPYRYSYYYYPGGAWYPYSYRYSYWYPYNYYSNDLWYW